jgi:hypothetical protein
MTAMKQNCTRILASRFSNCATVQFEFIEWHSTFENIRSSLSSAHPASGTEIEGVLRCELERVNCVWSGRVPPTTRLLRHVLEEIMCVLRRSSCSDKVWHFRMCDVMFYLVEPHRTVVFDTVCRQANHAAQVSQRVVRTEKRYCM